jgi:hypothetical protein
MHTDEEIEAISHAWPMVGLDSNSTFQVYTEDSTYIKLYLVGYTGNGVAFFDNRVDKTPATADSWQDVNISADTGGDTAIAAIVGGFGASGLSYNFGLRKPAATPDDRYGTIDGDHQTWGVVGVDGSEVYQVYHGHLTEQESYLYGYVTSGVVMFDNAVDHSTATTGSYVDVDITSDIGTDDATGAIVHLFQDTGAEVALRKNGVSHDQYWEVENHQYGIVEIDDQDIFEQKIFNANVDLFLTGYALQCAVSATTQYRSVGTNTGDLASGDGITVKATVSSGGTTVTFTGLSLPAMDQVGAMGPGDKITLDPGGANEDVRYILSRDSATQVTLQSAVSNDHTVAANQDFNITRAYNTLSGWESARQRDLTATTGDDSIEVAVCYKDGVLQEIDVVEIDGWTTAEDNYIRIWVPEGQRHTGTAGTGFVLKPNTTTPQEWFLIFWIDELYVRFEGIEIDGSDIENAQFVGGIDTGNVDGVGEIRVDKCLIHDLTNPTQASSSAYIRGISIANDRSSRMFVPDHQQYYL